MNKHNRARTMARMEAKRGVGEPKPKNILLDQHNERMADVHEIVRKWVQQTPSVEAPPVKLTLKEKVAAFLRLVVADVYARNPKDEPHKFSAYVRNDEMPNFIHINADGSIRLSFSVRGEKDSLSDAKQLEDLRWDHLGALLEVAVKLGYKF